MRLKSIITSLLLFSVILLQAQGLLWEISGNGLEKNSYLYGTMHSQDKRAFVMTDALYEKLSEVEAFAPEVLIDDTEADAFSDIFILADGKELQDVLSKEDFKTVKKVFEKKTGMEIDFMGNMTPVGLMLMTIEAEAAHDFPYTVDDYLEKIASIQGKTIRSVETFAEQLALMDLMTDEMAIDYFKNPEETDKYDKLMRKYYADGDIEQLAQLFYKDPRYLDIADAFITKRNYIMAERIGKMAQEQPTFAAVGSGHLGGKEGVVALLRKEGYNVTALQGKVVGYRPELVVTKEEWYVFEPENVPFSIELPTKEPKAEVQEMEMPDGTTLKYGIYGHEPQEEDAAVKIYMVSHNKTVNGENSESISKEDLKAFFDESQAGSESRYGSPMKTAKDITHQGFPGREYETSFMGGLAQVYIRTFLVKDSFIIMQMFETSDAKPKREKFFGSLRIKE